MFTWPGLLVKASRCQHNFSLHGPGARGGDLGKGRHRCAKYVV